MSGEGTPAGAGGGRAWSPSLDANPRLEQWVRFEDPGIVTVATGKVEIGQGVVTALAQIAAEELGVEVEHLRMVSGDTDRAPDELYTSSSLSMETSGTAVRIACAEARARLLARAGQRLNCPPGELTVEAGEVRRATPGREGTGLDLWALAGETDLTGPVGGMAPLRPPSSYRIVGRDVPRLDLPAKVSGPAFIHDEAPEGLLHARVLRQPHPRARLEGLDEEGARRAGGPGLEIVRRASFVAFVSPSGEGAARARERAAASAVWSGVPPIDPALGEPGWLRSRPCIERVLSSRKEGLPVPAPADLLEVAVSRPLVAHASLAPSCALARFEDGRLVVWSHGQGMHPLRRALARPLGLEPERITVRHLHGAGCYGHNGADDAALDAALVARALPGRTVRVEWSREEEFRHEPPGPPMAVRVRVGLDRDGMPLTWETDVWSAPHVQRPGAAGGGLLAEWALPEPPPPGEPRDPPEERGGGATRNAVPLYRVPEWTVRHHLVADLPLRTSALRGLGAPVNVLAIESAMDELAARHGRDPVEWRLALLDDRRAREVLEAAARLARWSRRGSGGGGQGMGVGLARYKNRSAWAAVVAAVEVGTEVRLTGLWCAADAGQIVSPSGLRNQLEGGMVQAASWALREQVRVGPDGVESVDWDRYPILRFSDIPDIECCLIDRPGEPFLGAGECTMGPTIAAIANALAHALGARIGDLPLTRERIADALLA